MTEFKKELNRRADIIIRQEKQIQIDAEQIRALQKQNGELTDRVKELEEKLKKETAQRIYNFNKSIEWKEKHRELEAQIEKMKADVRVNIKVADQSNNCLMYQKLNSMLNQWEGKRR